MIMKTRKIYKRLAVVLTAALALAGCSDEWDDHYNGSTGANGNLWEAIESNPNLSNFATLLQGVGYDKALASSQMFTVFAPTNDNFSAEHAQALVNEYKAEKAAGTRDNDNTTIKEFVQNHIALYNYSVAPSSSDSIVMLNGKYKVLTASTFGGQTITQANQVYGNGVLYTLAEPSSFVPNIFENLSKVEGLDSVSNFLNSFNIYVFDAASSVPGDIVDGKTVYLDSVVNLTNRVLNTYIGRINSEDSTYWMIAPTNATWNKLVPKYEKYFQYHNGVYSTEPRLRDSLTWSNARMALTMGTVFSRTKNPDTHFRDSAVSYNGITSASLRKRQYGDARLRYYIYDKPFDAGGIFDGATQYTCSNGVLLKASAWNFKPTNTFMQDIYVEGENSARIDSVDERYTVYPITKTNVDNQSPFYNAIHDHAFGAIAPSGSTGQPLAYYNLPNLLSNVPYDIYVVTAPAIAGDSLATDLQRRPTRFRIRLAQPGKDGKFPSNYRQWTTFKHPKDKINNTDYWITTKDQVDTFLVVKDFKFTYCGYGQTPTAQLIFDTFVTTAQERNGTYNRYLNIDYILLKPHEEE